MDSRNKQIEKFQQSLDVMMAKIEAIERMLNERLPSLDEPRTD